MAVAADRAADLDIAPSLDEVRALARDYTLVPLRHTFIADTETPVSAYLKLRAEGPSFLLESAEQGQRFGRFSFVGVQPRAVMRMQLHESPDPYGAVARELERYRPAPLEGLPPFAGYATAVERVKDYIRAGDAYQVVPSQRWSADMPCEAFSLYRGLRAVNPSPYMYYLDFEDFQIAGASPEPLVKVEGRRAEQRPIAGTRPRGATLGGGARVAADLLEDEKERAEHVMLVDLGRNDLGRVCEYGSVKVDELMVVEQFSHVMHIVSSVSGKLREGVTAMDALRAALPAGTMSGAPQIRAVQLIDDVHTP